MSDDTSYHHFIGVAQILLQQHSVQVQEAKGDKASKLRKSLNAFMAFRAYYQGLFPGVEQKERSGYITFLWRQEKNSAGWAVLAKGFTVIRDISIIPDTDKPKLKEYLGLNAPFIGLPPPPNNSAPELIQFYLKSVNKCTGTVLVEDVVANTLAHGFLKGFNPAQTYDMPIVVMAAITSIEKSVIENNGHTIPSISSATYQTATNEQVAREPNSFQPDIGANLATNANDLGMETVLTHNGYIAEGIEAEDDSYNIWQAEYTRHINELHMAELARTLMYQGGVEDREEFGENSEAPTDFDPYAGDPWTTYNISAPAEDILKSLMEK